MSDVEDGSSGYAIDPGMTQTGLRYTPSESGIVVSNDDQLCGVKCSIAAGRASKNTDVLYTAGTTVKGTNSSDAVVEYENCKTDIPANGISKTPFSDLGLSRPVLELLKAHGLQEASPIQASFLKASMVRPNDQQDVIIECANGSGKTKMIIIYGVETMLCASLPPDCWQKIRDNTIPEPRSSTAVMGHGNTDSLMGKNGRVRPAPTIIFVAPTRALAKSTFDQVCTLLNGGVTKSGKIASGINDLMRDTNTRENPSFSSSPPSDGYSGSKLPPDFTAGLVSGVLTESTRQHVLSKPLDIVVATPGQLSKSLDENELSFSRVRYIVLDECNTYMTDSPEDINWRVQFHGGMYRNNGKDRECRGILSYLKSPCTRVFVTPVKVSETIEGRTYFSNAPVIRTKKEKLKHTFTRLSHHPVQMLAEQESKTVALEIVQGVLSVDSTKFVKNILIFFNSVKAVEAAVSHFLVSENLATLQELTKEPVEIFGYHGKANTDENSIVESTSESRHPGFPYLQTIVDSLENANSKTIMISSDAFAAGIDYLIDVVIQRTPLIKHCSINDGLEKLVTRANRAGRGGQEGISLILMRDSDTWSAAKIAELVRSTRGELEVEPWLEKMAFIEELRRLGSSQDHSKQPIKPTASVDASLNSSANAREHGNIISRDSGSTPENSIRRGSQRGDYHRGRGKIEGSGLGARGSGGRGGNRGRGGNSGRSGRGDSWRGSSR